MPTLREAIDKSVVSTPPETTVHALLELARRRPSRIFTWVVVPMPPGGYAVTRLNEIAEKAEELGDAILDMALDQVPGLLQQGGSVQAGASLDEAREQARSSPGERIPVLEGEQVLGVLSLGPRRPPLPALDPWQMEGVARFLWPYDDLKLSHRYQVLEPGLPARELAESLARSKKGWLYLVVPTGAGFYHVMAVDSALVEALNRLPPRLPGLRVGELPLPAPVQAVEEGTISWEVARERVLDTPARCLPVTRGGQVIGVLAEPDRRVPTLAHWIQAFGGAPPWVESHQQMTGGEEPAPPEPPLKPPWEPP